MATVIGQTRKPYTTPAYQYIREADQLPSTDEAAEQENPLCRVKLFNPTGIGTWFLAGYDPETGIGYGLCHLHEAEVGDVSLHEIVEVRGAFGLPIERDLHFKPTRVNELLAQYIGA